MRVLYLPAAEKYLRKLKDQTLKQKFKEAIITISNDHSVGKQKQGDLAGIWCYDIYHNKTNYELAYRIHEAHNEIIVVVMAGTRENFYEALKRYMNGRS